MDSTLCQRNLEFGLPIFIGIPDSLSCIPDSKAHDSGFHEQKFPLFSIPKRKKKLFCPATVLLKARNICKILSFFIKPKKKFICNRKSKIYMDIKLSEAFDVFQEHVLWDIPLGRSMRLRSAVTGEQSARMDNGSSWTI